MMTESKNVKIQKINLIKFGKFENYTIEFDEGLNLIYGKNEAGKSTIQLFLKAMLYGLPARKRSGEALKERERAIPWKARTAEGAMTLLIDGRVVEIHRIFGKTQQGDKTQVCDGASGQIIPEYNVRELGEILFGMSADLFEKTLWISQRGIFMGGKDEELSKRLINLQSSGDESVSVSSALATIEGMRREIQAKDGRSTKGRLDLLKTRLDQCKREKYDLATQLSQTEQTRIRATKAKEELRGLEKEIAALEEEHKKSVEAKEIKAKAELVLQIDESDKKLNLIYNSQDYKNSRGLDRETTEKAFAIEREIQGLKESLNKTEDSGDREAKLLMKSQRAGIFVGGGGTLAVIGIIGAIICGFVLGNIPMTVVSAALGIIGLILVIRNIFVIRNYSNVLQELRAGAAAKEAELKKNEEEIKAKESALKSILESYGVKDSNELSELYTTGQGLRERVKSLEEAKAAFLGGVSYEELKAEAEKALCGECRETAEIDGLLRQKRAKQLELVAEIKAIDSKMAYQVTIERIPSDIDTEINGIQEEIQELERQLFVIGETEKAIKEAGEIWNRENLPRLGSRVSELTKILTEGKYDGVRVSDQYMMRVPQGEELFDAEYFSFGTYEQLYLALRLGVAELITQGRILLLDDILTAYDDSRALSSLKLLKEFSEDWQTILFTCHERDAENGKNLEANTILI